MELNNYINEFFDGRNYNIAKTIPFGKDNPLYGVFTKDLPSCLRRLVNKLDDTPIAKKYEYNGSIGKGGFADVFWFGCKLPLLAPSWHEGFYIVYLLSKDAQSLYLSLMLGTEIIFTKAEFEQKVKDLRIPKEELTSILQKDIAGADGIDLTPFDFGKIQLGDTYLAKAYEIANIFSIKYDSTEGAPTQTKIEDDLKNFLEVYKRCAFIYDGKKVPNCK